MAKSKSRIAWNLLWIVVAFVSGLFVANFTITYGVVDFVAGMPDKKVMLNRDVRFINGKGTEYVLPKGTVLTWEGAQGNQYYLSIRYILNDGSAIVLVENDASYDFLQQ